MLQNPNWPTADALARNQLRVFSSLGEQLRLSEDARRRALRLSDQDWARWRDFLNDGPLPAQPQPPVMLRRLGSASYRLAVMAERQGMRC